MNSIPVSEMGLPQWFALAVKPRFDKAVARTLETKGFETFLPLYKKRHNYGTRCREFDLPLFPGYVFCRFNALMRLPIVTTPGVTHILGVGNRPAPLSETEPARPPWPPIRPAGYKAGPPTPEPPARSRDYPTKPSIPPRKGAQRSGRRVARRGL